MRLKICLADLKFVGCSFQHFGLDLNIDYWIGIKFGTNINGLCFTMWIFGVGFSFFPSASAVPRV